MWFKKKRIYLDHASATPVLPEALRAMREAEKTFANPGAIHAEGVEAKGKLESARATIALWLGCKPREVIFTSGLTESNNLAILGVARRLECHGFTSTSGLSPRSDLGNRGPTSGTVERGTLAGTHWITSSIEHPAVLESFAEVERLGGAVTHIEPNKKGIISSESVLGAMRSETILVSIGWANSEVGTVQPIRDISRSVREHSPHVLIHSDAGQAPLYLSPQVHTLGVDLFSLGANKLYGPHGIGALYVSNRAELSPITFGGRQERGLRAGTESVALVTGFAIACEHTARERERERERVRSLRNYFARELEAHFGVTPNGSLDDALPHMLNVSFPNISSEYLTLALDRAGMSVSTKSACREGEESQSHVVAALGGEEWRASHTIRFSLGRETFEIDINKVVITLAGILVKNVVR